MVNKVRVLRGENITEEVVSTPVTVTGAWADLTDVVFSVKGFDSIAVWFDLTIRASRDIRFRAVALPSKDSTEIYNIPIQTVEPDVVKLEPEYFELNVDVDSKLMFQVSVGDLVSYIKLQVMAGNVGGPGVATVDKVLLSVKGNERGI